MRIYSLTFALFGLVLVLPGCRQKEEIKVYRVVKEDGQGQDPTSVSADPHAGLPMNNPSAAGLPPGHPPTQGGGGTHTNTLADDAPDDWEAGRSSSMRLASYQAKGTAGEMADISLVILAGTGVESSTT